MGAILTKGYRPLSNTNALSPKTLMTALDTADRYSLEDACVIIANMLQRKKRNGSLEDTFAMLNCCVRHSDRFPLDFVVRQFTRVCTGRAQVSFESLEGMDPDMIAHVARGREIVIELAHSSSATNVTSLYWPIPSTWNQVLAETFLITQTGFGWEIARVRQQ